MASFIYLYAKFTEEFLLLTGAGVFTLLSAYCYTWVVKKRRLGAARDLVPAGLVKVYLSQLINEAQFVRTQLFGLAGGTVPSADNFAAHFQQSAGVSAHTNSGSQISAGGEIPSDLLERLKALENQLADKESMVVNINVEKTKLLEEVENLKQNEKVMTSGVSGNNQDLIQKIKALEERLEEYALFEDDLANLKRLQQENASLKKQIEQAPTQQAAPKKNEPAIAEALNAVPAMRDEPEVDHTKSKESLLDRAAIDALLDGVSAIPPTPTEVEAEEALAGTAVEPQLAPPTSIAPKPKTEDFENLIDSVENSLSAQAKSAPAPAEKVLTQTAEAMLAAPAAASAQVDKTDEELLKEFENLLNS